MHFDEVIFFTWTIVNNHILDRFLMAVGGIPLSEWVESYDCSSITIAVVASHSSLQILHGARKEGFRTLGICVGEERRKMYSAFPGAEPDEWLILEDYKQLMDHAEFLRNRNAIMIPHGSLVEYLGPKLFQELEVPTFGNRNILEWEGSRERQRIWLESGGCEMPKVIDDPKDIDGPVIVKYAGAKGGRGYFIARNFRDFRRNVDLEEEFTIQEYVLGTRYYFQFFFDPIPKDGYQVEGMGTHSNQSLGRLELMSIDRRDEANVDEFYKLGSLRDIRDMGVEPSFVVTGNTPAVLRESLLPQAFKLGEGAVAASMELGDGGKGMIGPFCLETIVTDKLEFRVFEVSARIVAGSNVAIGGSPYSDINEPGISTGQRVARCIKKAIQKDRLLDVLS